MQGWLMLVLYVVMATGQPKLETKVFKEGPACDAAANLRAGEISLDGEKFLVTAGCLSGVPVKEAAK